MMIWSKINKKGVSKLQNKTINDPYGFVYIITNLINGKRYIGQRKFDERGKWKHYMGSGTQIILAIQKYGKENFHRNIVYIAYSAEELSKAEQDMITILNAGGSEDYYNISDGYWTHPFNNKTSDELDKIKRKMSISHSNYMNSRTPEQVKYTARASSLSLKNFYAENPDTLKAITDRLDANRINFWESGDEEKKKIAKQKISEKARIKMNDPEYRKNHRQKLLNRMKDPENAINDHINHVFSNANKQQISDTLMKSFRDGTNKSAQAMKIVVDEKDLFFTTKKFAYHYLVENNMLYYRTKDPNKQMSYNTFKGVTYRNEPFPNFTYEILN